MRPFQWDNRKAFVFDLMRQGQDFLLGASASRYPSKTFTLCLTLLGPFVSPKSAVF